MKTKQKQTKKPKILYNNCVHLIRTLFIHILKDFFLNYRFREKTLLSTDLIADIDAAREDYALRSLPLKQKQKKGRL